MRRNNGLLHATTGPEPQNIMLPKKRLGDFHGGSAVKILHFQCRELGFSPLSWGSKIPHALQWGKNIKIKKVRHTDTIYICLAFLFYMFVYIYTVFTIPFLCKPIKRQKIYYLIIKMRIVVTADWQKESFRGNENVLKLDCGVSCTILKFY